MNKTSQEIITSVKTKEGDSQQFLNFFYPHFSKNKTGVKPHFKTNPKDTTLLPPVSFKFVYVREKEQSAEDIIREVGA